MPEVEQNLARFRAAHTQVLGVSVDSVFSHANWGKSLGGVSFPLLADFHPKGGLAASLGLYLEGAGITDRATVIIDANGIVRHASSVTPKGKRDIGELAGLCEQIDQEHGGGLADFADPKGLGEVGGFFVKSNCGPSRKVLLARDNLHLTEHLQPRNVSEDPAARDELVKLAGKDQAPCLIVDGKVLQDSDEIVGYLASVGTDL